MRPCFLSEDVEDELIKEDIVLSPPPSLLKMQMLSKPIDLLLAKVGVSAEGQGSTVSTASWKPHNSGASGSVAPSHCNLLSLLKRER